MSFRNRCRIAGAEGAIDLSIPLEKGRDQKSLIREVRISESGNWRSTHWRAIQSCYSRSPWFEFYQDGLRALYDGPVVFLADWNLACFKWSLGCLGMTPRIAFTDAWRADYPAEEWLDWRGKLRPSDSGTPEPAPHYHQVFEYRTGFLPGLSILDLIFCEGKRARKFLAG